jgi:hypothetical protein
MLGLEFSGVQQNTVNASWVTPGLKRTSSSSWPGWPICLAISE